jgi:predicted ATPase/DNA-binding SARP family transcriptional activator
VEFRVLGPLDVIVDGESARLGGPRPRAVLGTLLVHAGAAVSVERLVEQVWGDAPPPTVNSALQVHISALRKVLGDRLVTTATGYLVQAETDATRFEAMVAAARRHLAERPARAAKDLVLALELWRGEPYGGVPGGPDVDAARQRLAELRLAVLEDRLDAELSTGRHAEVVSELAGLVVDHPLRERLTALYLLALYRNGRVADARAAYAAIRERLAAELGVAPGGELTALARAIDRGDPTLEQPAAVPAPASRFIGRRRELEELARQLGETRLLTVTGPGGAGKTRLALELVRDTATDHPDGAHLIDLASSPAGSSIVDRVVAAFDVWPRSDESLTDTLIARLRGARALLVLDNCEHVVESAATLAERLLSQCAGLRILATSREPLGVPGERVWPLAGLGVPADADTSAAAVRTEAVRLLADRGAAAKPGFAVNAGNIGVAAALCRRLDGLPLAIELAAAQLRVLAIDEVAARLDERLELADTRAPDRHRTMRAAIDWGHDLLAEEEQALFRRLAVFVGGCDPAAAQRVADAQPDVLDRLVDQSMLVAQPHPHGTRYRMLELVKEYAIERLEESGEAAELRGRHAAWCAAIAKANEQYGGADHADLVRRLRADEANLRAALDWSVSGGGDPVRALEIASPLWWYWWTRGLIAEARNRLRKALAMTDATPSAVRGAALRAASSLIRNSGDYDEAREVGEESLAVYRSIGDDDGVSSALNGLCVTAVAQRDYHAALRFGEDCRELSTRIGNRRRLGAVVNCVGIALRCLGKSDAAAEAFAEAMRIFVDLDDRRSRAASVGNLAFMARQAGDLDQARRGYRESLAIYRDITLVEGQLDALDGFACIETAAGNPAAAVRLLSVADRELRRLGVSLFVPDEIAAREEAWTSARAALGDKIEAIVRSAREESLDAVVDGLLNTVH